LKIRPDYAEAYNNICSAYIKLEEYEKAIEACNHALKIKPDYELAKNNLLIAQQKLKN
jgi:lipoprotein NlpI